MANPAKGEIELELSDGRKLVLVADFQSRVVAERAYEAPFSKVIADVRAEYHGAIQAMLYGLLKRGQPDITLDEVGELIDNDGDDIMRAATEAMEAAAPKSEGKESANPPRRGKTSGVSGAKAA